jgi:hypothetical protein
MSFDVSDVFVFALAGLLIGAGLVSVVFYSDANEAIIAGGGMDRVLIGLDNSQMGEIKDTLQEMYPNNIPPEDICCCCGGGSRCPSR